MSGEAGDVGLKENVRLGLRDEGEDGEDGPSQNAGLAAREGGNDVAPWVTKDAQLTLNACLGYTWRTDVGGSLDTYRSIVNLGSGPKLLGTEFKLVDPKHRIFDQIRVRAYSALPVVAARSYAQRPKTSSARSGSRAARAPRRECGGARTRAKRS